MPAPPLIIAAAGVAAMLLAMLAGPLVSHPDYDSLRHSTSELAGRNMPSAWIMRTGFAAFGIGTAIAALWRVRANPACCLALVVFGLGMVGAAIWPHDPITPRLGSNPADDRVHSIAASLAGMAFAAAVAVDLAAKGFPRRDALGWLALAASLGLPLLMLAMPATAGFWQRLMFGISFLWLLRLFATQK